MAARTTPSESTTMSRVELETLLAAERVKFEVVRAKLAALTIEHDLLKLA